MRHPPLDSLTLFGLILSFEQRESSNRLRARKTFDLPQLIQHKAAAFTAAVASATINTIIAAAIGQDNKDGSIY